VAPRLGFDTTGLISAILAAQLLGRALRCRPDINTLTAGLLTEPARESAIKLLKEVFLCCCMLRLPPALCYRRFLPWRYCAKFD
jgi:hypothetical protein